MNQKFKIPAIFFILVLLSPEISTYNPESPGICSCSDCDDCENALNNNTACYSLVKLTIDITSYSGTCINNPSGFNNKIFDCQGYKIDGDGTDSDYGIYLNGKSGNVMRNCAVTDFWDGIYLYSSVNNTLINNTVNSNSDNGIFIRFSQNNTISGNTINSNNWHGVSIDSSDNMNISANLASFNNNMGIFLSNTMHARVFNNTVNSNSYGICLYLSSNNTLTNNTANLNYYGILLYSSLHNNIIKNDVNSNTQYGFFSEKSSSLIENNTVNYNSVGVKINDSYCSMKYNVTPDTVLFYYATWCPHCQTMEPWIRQLEQEGYKFHWAEYSDANAVKVINDCMPIVSSDGFPHFGCTSNGKDHIGEFSSITEMRNFADECKNDANKSTIINSNAVCSNIISDFGVINSSRNFGDNNTCTSPDGWNDTGTTGCTYICPPCEDNDNDGYGVCLACNTTHGCGYNGNDCDDSNSSINLNATEVCDGIDNNCDNKTDEEDSSGCMIYYADIDVDGYGNASYSKCLCAPSGVYNTTNNSDCNDNDADNWNSCTACRDNDSDDWFVGCDAYIKRNGTDCNDNNSLITPNATEIYNQIDDNCNGIIDEGFCNTNDNCSSSEFCNTSNQCQSKKQNFETCANNYECLFDNCDTGFCIHPCDFNHDGIIIQDYNDLMAAYKCFLRIENNCDKISFQDLIKIKGEYQCFAGN